MYRNITFFREEAREMGMFQFCIKPLCRYYKKEWLFMSKEELEKRLALILVNTYQVKSDNKLSKETIEKIEKDNNFVFRKY